MASTEEASLPASVVLFQQMRRQTEFVAIAPAPAAPASPPNPLPPRPPPPPHGGKGRTTTGRRPAPMLSFNGPRAVGRPSRVAAPAMPSITPSAAHRAASAPRQRQRQPPEPRGRKRRASKPSSDNFIPILPPDYRRYDRRCRPGFLRGGQISART